MLYLKLKDVLNTIEFLFVSVERAVSVYHTCCIVSLLLLLPSCVMSSQFIPRPNFLFRTRSFPDIFLPNNNIVFSGIPSSELLECLLLVRVMWVARFLPD